VTRSTEIRVLSNSGMVIQSPGGRGGERNRNRYPTLPIRRISLVSSDPTIC
jgi:hypothetical protein